MVKTGGKKKQVKNSNLRWLIIGGVATLLITAVPVGLYLWFALPGSTKEIVAVADQFKPDPSWELKSENIQPPVRICIDVECPSVNRQWESNHIITNDELSLLLQIAGWDFQIEGRCSEELVDTADNIRVCTANGIIDGYNAQITIRRSGSVVNSHIGLNIWKG